MRLDQADDRDRRILDDWTILRKRALLTRENILEAYKGAYDQAVLLPIELQLYLNDMNIAGELEPVEKGCAILTAVAKSRLFATQGRSSANAFADHARNCLDKDHELTERFHALKDGKWNQ